jgi:hypothetical protein
MQAVLRRIAATRGNASNAILLITWFRGSIGIEKIHPLEGGLLRFKFRRDRRAGMPIESAWTFYPRYFAETVTKLARFAGLYCRLRIMYLKVKYDAAKLDYTDLALSPVTDEELDTMELFQSPAAEAYVARVRPSDAPRAATM